MNNMNVKPTEGEMEILKVLWKKGNCTVREVHETLNKKDAGYTTTLKLMQIIRKRIGSSRVRAKYTFYKALINREKTQQQLVNKMIDNVFNKLGSTFGYAGPWQ